TLYREFGRERGPLLVGGSSVAQSVPVKDPYKFQRVYPRGPLYSHVTGYYSIVYGLAMVSKPEYDPNRLASHDVAEVRKAMARLLADPDRPLENRAIASRL